MPPPHIRRTIRRGQEKVVVETPSGIAFALPDGALISTDEEHPGIPRVEEGKPLYIRYSSFYLNLKDVSDRKTQILITTQAEADEKITKAPPFVTRWDDEASANAPTYSFRDWGAARAGHPMIFYSKAYLGETIRFTTYVWEIDRADEALFSAIGKALDTGAGLPVFLDLVPAMGAAKIALNLLQGVANWIDKDDPVIRGKDIDLGSTRLLRPGRYVVSVGISEPDLIARHKLEGLQLKTSAGAEITGSSYFTFDVVSQEQRKLERFDQFAGAAEILARTNRGAGGGAKEGIELAAEALGAYSDLKILDEIDISKRDKRKLEALRKRLSPQMQRALETYLDELETRAT